jgi:hypothetical protein
MWCRSQKIVGPIIVGPIIACFPTIVGNYGTRNIVVIGMMVLERPTECIQLMICLSSILRGIPLSGGSPSPVFTAVV